MRTIACACVIVFLCNVADAQETPQAMPIAQLVAAVAAKTGKRFVIDPRVQGDAMLIGQRPASVTLTELATILQVHDVMMFESGGYVQVVPDSVARMLPIPMLVGNTRHPDTEMVTRVIKVKSMPAAGLIPLLRPIVPQSGHLVAVPCANLLLLVDTYANVRRFESVVQALDTGSAPFLPETCDQVGATEKR